VIALGLAIQLIAAGLLIVGVVLDEAQASTPLWSAIAMELFGLVVVAVGVQRARPPRRSVTPPRSALSPITRTAPDGD